MEPLEQLRERISGFPGYDNHLDRRRSDEYVRSYLGEALAEMGVRCALSPDVQARLDALLLRVGFADPRAFSNHDGTAESNDGGEVAVEDAATLGVANRAPDVDCASAAAYFDEVSALLDRRDAALRAAAAATP
jgi:hypothetical protein